MSKKILYVRTGPYDLHMDSYNVQEIGLGEAFCKLGYDFDFVTFKKKNPKEWVFFEQNGCRAKCIEMPRHRFLRWGINFSICTKEFLSKYDFVFSSEYMQIMSYLLSRNASKMFIYNGPYYNLFMFKWFSPVYDFLFTRQLKKNVSRIFAKSVLAKVFLESKSYDNVTTVGVGLDSKRFDNETIIKPETQELIDYMRANKCILYVGAISDRKNFPFMLEVYAKILEKDPSVKFVIIGKSVVGPFAKFLGKKDADYERECLKLADANVLAGIHRVQRIDNPQLKFVYPLARAFLLPSKQEIFGMVLLEAMFLGAPVVTSKNGGSMTLIDRQKTGQIVDFDVDQWVSAVMRYLNDDAYKNSVCENARKIVAEKYNWNVIAANMLNYME